MGVMTFLASQFLLLLVLSPCTYAHTLDNAAASAGSSLSLISSSSRSLIRPSSVSSLTIPLAGGLLHASGFFFNATVGDQRFTLQVDLTYSSLIIPYKTCMGCRIGDRRYDPSKSPGSGGERITCGDRRCHSLLDDDCESMRCFQCSTRGRCCVESDHDDQDRQGCAFNVLYGDSSSGNGTLYMDKIKLPGSSKGKPSSLQADVLFGAMHEESHNFELPYADGVFGLAFQKGACRPSCFPPLMDSITNSTGVADIFTLCVGRYGGTLVLGEADLTLAKPGSQFAYVDLIPPTGASAATDSDGAGAGAGPTSSGGTRRNMLGQPGARFFFSQKDDDPKKAIERFMVPILPTWKVNERDVSLPGITNAVFTAGLSDIAMTKTSFLALLEHLMTYHCDVPGLCSISSWFRPQHCAEFEDEILSAMPNITIPFTTRVSITLTPNDYLIPYRGRVRCVAVVVSDSLAKKGIGLLLGSTVMARYTVAFDRANRRLGVALSAGSPKCGPEHGSDIGLPSVPGANGDVLTADAPAAPIPSTTYANSSLLLDEENCRAQGSCTQCASNRNCSFSYENGKCVPLADAGSQPLQFCSGALCACFTTGKAGWYFGIVTGMVLCLAVVLGVLLLWRKRQQQNFYRAVNDYEEQDLETF